MKRLFASVCGLLLVLSVCLPVGALSLTYTPSTSYQSSAAHKRAAALPESGDTALDTVALAMTQLGYHEGNSFSQTHGKNTSGTGNFTEYNYAYGKIGGSYAYAWCAAFASWCLRGTGAEDAAGGLFASCTLWVERLTELGQYRTRASGYHPATGDLIFFRAAGTARASDHVGLVRYVSGGRVYTVEGNASNAVTLRDYALTDTYIVGYGRPDYTGKSLKLNLATLGGSAGWYSVTNDTLNLRATPSTSGSKLAQVTRGAFFKVDAVKDGWGRTVYQGKTAWFSLEHAAFVTPFTYEREIDPANGTEGVQKKQFLSTQTAFTPDTVPEKEGSRFLHWQGSDGKTYAPGDALPTANLTLTALYEELPPPPPPPEPEPTPDIPEDNAPTAPPSGGAETESGSTTQTEAVQTPSLNAPEGSIAEYPTEEASAGNPRATLLAGILCVLLSALTYIGLTLYKKR